MKGRCEYCGKPFEAKRPRRCCDRSCAAKLAHETKGLTPWEDDAVFWLEQNAGRYPLSELINRFNGAARRNGWGKRSPDAIKLRLSRNNLSRKCTEDNMGRYEIARAFGIHPDRVRLWNKKGLPYRKIARNQCAIRVKDLREFLLTYPELATGIDEQSLEWVLGKPAAEKIAAAEKSTRGYPRPVLCVSTGEKFPGIKAAARAKLVHQSSIRRAINSNGRCLGHEWRYLA
jgi:hypothetical protein